MSTTKPATERFRLKFFVSDGSFVQINWARGRDRVSGDCYVSTIKESSDPKVVHPHAPHDQRYSPPMTLDEIRAYVAARPEMLGSQIHDCIGVELMEDELPHVFAEPIRVGDGPISTRA